MAMRVIDDSDLQNIAVAIQSKDNGSQMTVKEMRGRIENIPTVPAPVQNPALILWDWEGTKLAKYSREDALALTELPTPNTLGLYAGVDHDLLLFQKWNWNLVYIQDWIRKHKNVAFNAGAIYTTTDGQNHNYWSNQRLDDPYLLSVQKRGVTTLGGGALAGVTTLKAVTIPDGNINIPAQCFYSCSNLKFINIPDGVVEIGSYAFYNCTSLTQINLPNSIEKIYDYAFYNCSFENIIIPNKIITIFDSVFKSCIMLQKVQLPSSVQTIQASSFLDCKNLCDIVIESKATLSNTNAFGGLPSIYRIYVPRANLSWHETETNWSLIYAQGHIVVIEDYIDYLESIGFNVDKYKGATA